eukprot:CAMPEP_0114983210 /NCGR_PEP_ID=MMETSP0216-20121206/6567_1 /TAXON_ID=223996 /ORGANISM="Protocruzia adherens, Strain Boccale" /LENGTH=238 /DNA_ID=CAMNT_0002345155 /DNA_START=61 /DNA_END=777 /DNA_ORIENTATION=+
MDSFKYSEKEFNIRSELIANLTKKVVVDGEIEFIVHFQIIPDGKERKIKVNAIAPLDGQVWSLVLTIDTLIEHRDELGIEGDWKSYFTLLRRSILGDRNGKISLTMDEDDENFLALEVQYGIASSSKLEGSFQFEEYVCGHDNMAKYFRQVNALLFKMHEANIAQQYEISDLNERLSRVEAQMPSVASSGSGRLSVGGAGAGGSGKPESSRKKKGSNLVNPHSKKRIKTGPAKIGGRS